MGVKLRGLMDERDWSRADLTRAARKHMPDSKRFGPDNTSNFVNGKRRPTRPFVKALCGAFGVEPEDFMPPYLLDDTAETAPTPPLLTQVAGKDGIYRVVIDMELSLKDATRLLRALGPQVAGEG